MEHGIRGTVGFCQRAGRCSSMPFSKSTCVEVPQAEASSVLARIEDLQGGFDLTTFPQSSGVSISWEQQFEISECMFEILDLQILNLQNCQCFMDNIHMHTVQLKSMFNLSLTCHALTTCSFCNLFTWPKHGFWKHPQMFLRRGLNSSNCLTAWPESVY